MAGIPQIAKHPRHHDARPSLNDANEGGNAGLGPEHCGRPAVSLSTTLVHQERSGIMSDPRYTDPRRNDPWRRYDGSGGAGNIWPWIAAALAAVVALGLLIGYQRSEHASMQSSPPTTTGSAPSQSRPAPPAKFGDMPAAPAPAPNQ